MTGDALGVGTVDAVKRLRNGELLLLENLRFHAEEEKNDPAFAKALASYADVYGRLPVAVALTGVSLLAVVLALVGEKEIGPAQAVERPRLPERRRECLDREARRRDPFDPRSASARGRLSFFEKRFPEAVGDLLEAALLRPEGVPDSTELRFLRAARALVVHLDPIPSDSRRTEAAIPDARFEILDLVAALCLLAHRVEVGP